MLWTNVKTSAGATVGGVSGEGVDVGEGGVVVVVVVVVVCCDCVDVGSGRGVERGTVIVVVVVGGEGINMRELDVLTTGGSMGCDVIG